MDMFQQRSEEMKKQDAPLAARMRPESVDEFVGQEHLMGEGRILRKAIEGGHLPSIIFWGPPGSGKTTLANIIARTTHSHFSPVSAASAGVADLRKVVNEAKERRGLSNQKTILFIDEIHRFNKAQQDAVLPYVEDGTITMIGATTENPSFEVISALLSRSRVFVLKALTKAEVKLIILRAVKNDLKGLGKMSVQLPEEALDHLIDLSIGDARVALNILESAVLNATSDNQGHRHLTLADMEDAAQKKSLLYDKEGEQHYDIISALHKSIRGSDPDASLYWLGRMLESGEDPLYIARRIVRAASEDIGMADPQALPMAMAAQQAVHFIGMPEGALALAEAVVYLSTAPKSNTLYTAYKDVQQEVARGGNDPVPLHLRNAPTQLMKKLDYGKGYKYAHNYPGYFVKQQNLPDSLKERRFYHPSDQGYEKEVAQRLKTWWGRSRKGAAELKEGEQP